MQLAGESEIDLMLRELTNYRSHNKPSTPFDLSQIIRARGMLHP